jgi:hypothetical protein
VLSQGGDCYIGETWVAALCHGFVGQPSEQPRSRSVERQNALRVALDQPVEPELQSVGALDAARPPKLADALSQLGHGDARDVELALMGMQPVCKARGQVNFTSRRQR